MTCLQGAAYFGPLNAKGYFQLCRTYAASIAPLFTRKLRPHIQAKIIRMLGHNPTTYIEANIATTNIAQMNMVSLRRSPIVMSANGLSDSATRILFPSFIVL